MDDFVVVILEHKLPLARRPRQWRQGQDLSPRGCISMVQETETGLLGT